MWNTEAWGPEQNLTTAGLSVPGAITVAFFKLSGSGQCIVGGVWNTKIHKTVKMYENVDFLNNIC